MMPLDEAAGFLVPFQGFFPLRSISSLTFPSQKFRVGSALNIVRFITSPILYISLDDGVSYRTWWRTQYEMIEM